MKTMKIMTLPQENSGNNGENSGNDGTPQEQEQNITPDNTPTQNNGDINGTWHVESGAFYVNIEGLGNYVSPYVPGSVADFDISVSKNTSDEHYTLKLSGSDVTEEITKAEQNPMLLNVDITSWLIQGKFTKDPKMPESINLEGEFEAPISGNSYFTHPSDNSYVFEYFASFVYTVDDNSTVRYRYNVASTGGVDTTYVELILKRVE